MSTQAAHQDDVIRHPARLKVLECKIVSGLTLAVVQLLEGELTTAMLFADDATGERWEVRGFAFASLAAVEQGRHGVLLAPVGHASRLQVGAHLDQLLPAAATPR